MKLPEIEEGPVQESSPYLAQVDAAQKQAAGTFEEGLGRFGQELVKSQNSRAAATLLSGLEDARFNILSRKTVSAQELRDELGPNYDSLPQEIKAQTTKTTIDESMGDSVTTDRTDIPMFTVAAHLYDAKAKSIMAKASGDLSPGWKELFQDSAAHEIIQQKMLLSRHQLYDMHDYIQAQTTSSAIDLANAGRFGEAREVLDGSNTLSLTRKNELQGHIDKIEQTRPLYEALRTGNIGSMAKMLTALGDPKQFTKLSEDERLSFTNRLESEINQFQMGIKKASDQQMKETEEGGWNVILGKERQGQPVSYSDIPMPGTVRAEAQKAMIEYVDKLNKGEKPETDWTLYSGLIQMTQNRQKFGGVNLLNYRNRLADPEFKQLLELQQGMKGGNPEKFDDFQNTDHAINVRLGAPPYSIDVNDKGNAETIGYAKSQVQAALAKAQGANGGKPLGLEERNAVIDGALRDVIDPRKKGYISDDPATVPTFKAGVPPTIASKFQQAVTSLFPTEMSGKTSKRVDKLKEQYDDYSTLEPTIEKAWMVQRGKTIDPNDAVQVWWYVRQNEKRLEGILARDGDDRAPKAVKDFKLTNLAVHELLQGAK